MVDYALTDKKSQFALIAQVNRGTLNTRQVKIPGIFVDCIVVAGPEYLWQTNIEVYNPAYSSEIRIPMQSIAHMEMSYWQRSHTHQSDELSGGILAARSS